MAKRHLAAAIGILTIALATLASADPPAALPPPAAPTATAPPPEPAAQPVAAGVWLIPGGIAPGREPDGNTVVFRAPQGLVVMDTGRHDWHWRAILDFAEAQRQPIVAVVNSHWHLDHVSGNPHLRAAFPRLVVYASNAIDAALQGFLPRSARDNHAYLAGAGAGAPPGVAADLALDNATIEGGAALRPDVVVAASGRRSIGGLSLQVNFAAHAATDGDVWLYDPRTGVAAVGDLVTLPAPFLDTACAAGWRSALATIWATPFRIAVPGHGFPMTRRQFGAWRIAFDALLDCSASPRPKAECAAGWTAATAALRAPGAAETSQSQGLAEYYVDLLRKNHGDSAYCTAPRAAGPATPSAGHTAP